MATPEKKPVDTRIKQTRRGYSTPRRIRELRIGPGNVVGGWTIETNGAFTSDEDENGFRIVLDAANGEITFDAGARIKNTSIPFSGVGGIAIEHGDGVIAVDVSGDGDGLGSQRAVMRNADGSVYIGIERNLLGDTRIVMGGLPTSFLGLSSGMVWNDGGTLKIVP